MVDVILISDDLKEVEAFKHSIVLSLDMKDLGQPGSFPGVEVTRDFSAA